MTWFSLNKQHYYFFHCSPVPNVPRTRTGPQTRDWGSWSITQIQHIKHSAQTSVKVQGEKENCKIPHTLHLKKKSTFQKLWGSHWGTVCCFFNYSQFSAVIISVFWSFFQVILAPFEQRTTSQKKKRKKNDAIKGIFWRTLSNPTETCTTFVSLI